MKRAIHLCFMLVVVFAVVAQGRAQLVVYSQPNDNPDGFCSSAISGQYCEDRMADNFSLTDPVYRKITEVTWWGSSDYYAFDDLTNFSHWAIVIYGEVNGLPDWLIYEELIAIEDIQCVETGYVNMYGGKEYMQTATLATPPRLFIDEPYWISIGYVAVEPYWDAWLWSLNYYQGDGDCAVDHFDGNGYQDRDGDLAFVLVGDPTYGCPRAGDAGRGCTADIDGSDDCMVTIADLAELLGAYGTCPGEPLYNPDADLVDDGDPCINIADLAELLGQYGDDCSY